LFVVAFVELFVVGGRVSGLADDKAVSSCLDSDRIHCASNQLVREFVVSGSLKYPESSVFEAKPPKERFAELAIA
jgi:hypothetical protein